MRCVHACLWLALGALLASPTRAEEVVRLRMLGGIGAWGIPPKEASDPRSNATRAVFDAFHKAHPNIRIEAIGGLMIRGPASEANFLMSMAGDVAPDVFYVNFRQLWNFYEQGFMYPLDEYIAKDPDVWKTVHPTIREVLTIDGHVYCLPWFQVCMALYYRKDLFAAVGLDPDRPPRNWDEFIEYGRRLTRKNPRLYGFMFDQAPQGKSWFWTNFLWGAGGEVLKRGPDGQFRAAFNTDAGVKTLDFYKRLTTETWRGPNGEVMGPIAPTNMPLWENVNAGRVAMWLSYSSDVMVNMSELNPELLGIAPIPKGPAGWGNEINAGSWAINATIKDKRKRDAAWQFIKFMAGEEAQRVQTEAFVKQGFAKLINPYHLKKFGYERYVQEVDPQWVAANEQMFRYGHPEVNGKNTQLVYLLLDTPLERAVQNPKLDSRKLLDDAAAEMNRKMLNYVPPKVMEARRRWAWSILAGLLVLASALVIRWVLRRKPTDDGPVSRPAGTRGPLQWATAWLLMLPAVATIAVWAYYPLARGLVIAFQDYKILLPPKWAGMDNFIEVFFSDTFWISLWNSTLYTVMSLAIGFFAPLILAIGLHEIPRGKMLFRTLYYLPAVTSGIVIMLVWRDFYDAAETGLINTLLAPVFHGLNALIGSINGALGTSIGQIAVTQDWLGNPKLAMLSIVIVAVWAGAGPGSIIYLAAMKNISEESYEAADLDGAGIWHKIRHITLPGLKPLILINLVGVFIASFKAMENIFVMTGGGPLNATRVLGLEIWYNAFMYLKFGYATAAAWVMGSLLIGFTVLQIRNLLRMRFSTAS